MKESYREQAGLALLDTLMQDTRYGLRQLWRNKGFTAVAVATLALGIGALTAIFSVVKGVLLEPLPFGRADRLVTMWQSAPQYGLDRYSLTHFNLAYYQGQTHDFEQIGAYSSGQSTLTGHGEPVRVDGAMVSYNFFDMLGARPIVGRAFLPEEGRPGNDNRVVLGYELWQRRFSGDRDVVGATVMVDGRAATVVGIAPTWFRFPADAELWWPIALDPSVTHGHFLYCIGLLKPGITPKAANADTDETGKRMALSRPDLFQHGADFKTIVTPLKDELVGDVRKPIWILFGSVSLLLLITCSNVASLLMARASVRMREIAVRGALGAGKSRLIRQLLTESALLAVLGGLAGCCLAAAGLNLFVTILPKDLPRIQDIRLDRGVLLFSFLATTLAGLLFGLAPAVRGARSNLQALLKEASGRVTGHRPNALVIAQFTLSMVLLIAAGLLIRSFENVLSVDPGFRTKHVLTFRTIPLGPKYEKSAEWHRYYRELLRRVRELPGVKQAGSTSHLPLSNRDMQDGYEIEHAEAASSGPNKVIDVRTATAGYFEAMGYRLKSGRTFRETESTPVAMIDEVVAKRHWPQGDAIGKRIRSSDPDPWFEIVGVVAAVHHGGFDAKADGTLFLPEKFRDQSQTFAVQTESDPSLLSPAIHAAASEIDPDLPVYQVRTMEQLASASLGRRRFAMQLLGFFAALALGLSAVGLYGVMAQSVAVRIKEIGIRMALGARPGEVMRMVLRDGLGLTLAGVILGSIAALGLSKFLVSQLFEVKPYDPSTFLMVIGVLGAVSLIAAYIPARRAVRIDPLSALRCE